MATAPATQNEQQTAPGVLRVRLVPYTPAYSASSALPHSLTMSPSLRFPPQERLLPPNHVLKIGRFTDRHQRMASPSSPGSTEDIRFRSKVVSRHHAELWQESGVLYLKDTASSSGTFLNQMRLAPQNVPSAPVRLKDGDCLQLGVEYRGGEEEVYRCVRMRVELNRPAQAPAYRAQALAALPNTTNGTRADTSCCICLLPLRRTPLLVTACLHTFHFACVRPLLRVPSRSGRTEEVDGFTCPLCRCYVDLLAEPPDDGEDWNDEDLPDPATPQPDAQEKREENLVHAMRNARV